MKTTIFIAMLAFAVQLGNAQNIDGMHQLRAGDEVRRQPAAYRVNINNNAMLFRVNVNNLTIRSFDLYEYNGGYIRSATPVYHLLDQYW